MRIDYIVLLVLFSFVTTAGLVDSSDIGRLTLPQIKRFISFIVNYVY